MDAVEIKMPIVLNQKHRQENFAVVGSGFSDDNLNDLVAVQDLISGQKRLWRLKQNSSQLYSLIGVIEEKPQKFPFERLNESESFSDSAVFDSEFITSLVKDADEDIDESIFNGVQVVKYPRKIIFSEEIKIETSKLKKRPPQIILEPYLFEDDE